MTYTLNFDVKVKFSAYDPFAGPGSTRKYIKFVDVFLHTNMNQAESEPVDYVGVALGDPDNDTPDDYTVVTTFGFDEDEP